MSNNRNNSLKFPSGRTVGQIKKDARQIVINKGGEHHSALDKLSYTNGLAMPFCQAVNYLIRKSKPKIKPADNSSNLPNRNLGTPGLNKQCSQNHGNRGKQLNPNQNRVTFCVKRNLLSADKIKKHGAEKLSRKEIETLRLSVRNNKSYLFDLDNYDFIRFKKSIKAGMSNTSGALQRIKSLMSSKLSYRQSSTYWIGSVQHIDKKHPDELYGDDLPECNFPYGGDY
jgi:hypothetical protein